ARVARDEQAVGQARRAVLAGAGQGLGARWVAMNDLTMSGPGALALRLLTVAFCVMLYLLPLILRSWRGETTHDRHATARAERERAELDADTAIAIKRAEVRRAAEIMWAEHQLTQTRLAIEAQAEIDREQQRRRIVEALEAPVHASSERTPEPALRTVEEDIYLPIEAEAEAASRAVAELPPGPPQTEVHDAEVTENLPVRSEAAEQVVEHYDERHVNDEERGTPLIPSIPDATKAAARWIRPLVPPFVARVIDNTTAPLRGARQVFEEVEEIAFSLKRTRKVTIDSQSSGGESPPQAPRSAAPESTEDAATGRSRVESSRGEGHHTTDYQQLQGPAGSEYPPLGYAPQRDLDSLSVGHNSARQGRHELAERQGPRELRPPEGPRELPPGT
ncbi:DUF4407 domain-containing protein, partial [Mycobacterium kiyosense]